MHMRTYLPVSSCACMNGPEGKGSGGYHDNITPSQVPLHFMSLYNPIFQERYFLLFFLLCFVLVCVLVVYVMFMRFSNVS